MWALFTGSLNWEVRREHGVYGILGQAYTNSIPDYHSSLPVGQHTLTLYTKCDMSVGRLPYKLKVQRSNPGLAAQKSDT